jgi:hypothetical protein
MNPGFVGGEINYDDMEDAPTDDGDDTYYGNEAPQPLKVVKTQSVYANDDAAEEVYGNGSDEEMGNEYSSPAAASQQYAGTTDATLYLEPVSVSSRGGAVARTQNAYINDANSSESEDLDI